MSLVVAAVVAVAYIALSVFIAKKPRSFFDASVQRMNGKRVQGNFLVVVAHPDDECMFFAPTIISFLRQRKGREKLLLLCLSVGDYGGQDGEKRQQELFRAARVLGLACSDVTVLDSEHVKDGGDWNEALVADIVHQHCVKNSVQTVITFDHFGVSGHKNHACIFHAAKRIPGVTLFALESVSLLRKYASALDLPLTLLLKSIVPSTPWVEVVSLEDREVVVRALLQHRSQMVWFRRLYALFSRYLLINTFQVYR